MELMRGKDRRTLHIMAAIYGSEALARRKNLSVGEAIQTAVAVAVMTMNEVEKTLERGHAGVPPPYDWKET